MRAANATAATSSQMTQIFASKQSSSWYHWQAAFVLAVSVWTSICLYFITGSVQCTPEATTDWFSRLSYPFQVAWHTALAQDDINDTFFSEDRMNTRRVVLESMIHVHVRLIFAVFLNRNHLHLPWLPHEENEWQAILVSLNALRRLNARWNSWICSFKLSTASS